MPLFLLKFLPLLLKLKGPAKIAGVFLRGNWKIVAPVLLVLVMGFTLTTLKNKIDRLEAERVEYSVYIDQAEEANQTQVRTITSLRAANMRLAQAVTVSEQVRADAYAAARDRERRAQIRLDDTITTLKELENETPTCAEISRIDIGAACPLSIELLRRAAQGTFDTDRSSDREGAYVSTPSR